jgi:hypothetical protein
MNGKDMEFRKNCQSYHSKILDMLKKGKVKEAQAVIDDISASLRAWEEVIKSARFKIRLLKTLYAQTTIARKKLGG